MQAFGRSRRIGDPCPRCGKPLVREAKAFFWSGQSKDGAHCKTCEAVWPIKGEEIEPLKHVRRTED